MVSILEHFVDFAHRLYVLVHVLYRLGVYLGYLADVLVVHVCYVQHVCLSLLPIRLCVFAVHDHMDQVALNKAYSCCVVQ